MRKLLLFIAVFAYMQSVFCANIVVSDKVITKAFIGNGVQWGGYDILPAWIDAASLSANDWEQMRDRLAFMRPPLVRIMISPGWNYLVDNKYNTTKSQGMLFPILDYCQEQGIDVQFGEWGHIGSRILPKKKVEQLRKEGKDIPAPTINKRWVEQSTAFLTELIIQRKYSCIKYFTAVNEPNGNWASTKGNMQLWESVISQLYDSFHNAGLTEHITFMAPDIAVWNDRDIPWFHLSSSSLDKIVGAYDIHSYPQVEDLHNGKYNKMLRAYYDATPRNKPIIIAELGLKEKPKKPLGITNAQRISQDPFASPDSQMAIYDPAYAIDMADATMQAINIGYAGVLYWSLDDAMYNYDGTQQSTKLKRWGLWNSLGSELCNNPLDESLRPWYYTTSLLCRFIPRNSTIYHVHIPDNAPIRAICAQHNGNITIAILNTSSSTQHLNLSAPNAKAIKQYSFIQSTPPKSFMPSPDNTLNINENLNITLHPREFKLFTNMK